jgi:hypothetical protein
MPEERLVAGYRRILAEIYSAEAYYRRCRIQIERAPARSSPLRAGSARALARAVWRLGLRGPRRAHFWRLAWHGLRRGTGAFARAITLAILGEHFLRYTAEQVLPRLDAALAEIRAGPAGASRQAAAPRESF